MKDKILIWGAGEFGKSEFLLSILKREYEMAGYTDSNEKLHGTMLGKYPIYSPAEIKGLAVDLIVVAVADKNVFEEILRALKSRNEGLKAVWYKNIYFKLIDKYMAEIMPALSYHVTAEKFIAETNMWADNIMSEVAFWAKVVANPKGANRKRYLERLENDKFASELSENTEYIEDYLCELDNAVVYDIGCGLVPRFGRKLKNGKALNISGIDPLASFYNKINECFAGREVSLIKFGMFEFIAKFVEENSADAIIINNALDHCIDPYKSIVECLKVLKTGGLLHLNHRRCEAVNGLYGGLHQWNLDYNDKDEFIIWNREGLVNVSESLGDVADVKVYHSERDIDLDLQSVTVEIIKKRNFEQIELVDIKNDEQILASFIEKLLSIYASPEINAQFKKMLEI